RAVTPCGIRSRLTKRRRGLTFPAPTVAGTREFEYHPNLCPSWQTERQKDYAGHDFMTYRYNRGYPYRLTNAPKALLKAGMKNIAIVPASMLPLTETLKERINTLPS